MAKPRLTVALVHDVFHDDDGAERLGRVLGEAASCGAALALLPELPLDRWAPATRKVRETDCEPPDGARHRLLATAAAEAGIAVLGGAIVRGLRSARRRNRALLFDARGRLAASYDKLHLPREEGFWESHHYEPGTEPPRRIDGVGMPLGIQICSDLNRPTGSLLLGALGAELILAPRATPAESYPRWLTVIRANAITACAYVLSANRPRQEDGVPIGGPSVAVAPDGEVLAESDEPLALVTIDRSTVAAARREYPGYLDVRADLYARCWRGLRDRRPRRR